MKLIACTQASKPSSNNNVDPICSQMANDAMQNTSFALADTSGPNAAFIEAADVFIKETLDSHIEATPIDPGVQIRGQTLIRDYLLSIGGAELCANEIAIYSRPNKPLWMKGKVPKITGVSASVFDSIKNLNYPQQMEAVSAVYAKLNLQGKITSQKTLKRCVIFENNIFIPILKVSFMVNKRPYIGLVTGANTIRSAAPGFLESTSTTTGTATVAVGGANSSGTSENISQTKTVQLSGLSSGGSLCSQNFVALSLAGNGQDPNIPILPPFSSNENFSYPQTDWKFFATTAFYNASQHVGWLLQEKFIPNWPGPQIQIVLNIADQSDPSNSGINNTAVYLPNGNSLSDPPQIQIGNGDGKVLQNIWTDADAVQHETGHHLIYTRLTNINDNIVIVIHEGYADAQVLLQNKSPCLCPKVCTVGSTSCITKNCLRSAANNYTMAAPDCPGDDGTLNPPQCLPTENHRRSQVISGMLWDIAQDIGSKNNGYMEALKLELISITYLSSGSEYDDMLEALIKADDDMGGKYQNILIKEMCARGFDNAQNTTTQSGSWMSTISVKYTCPAGSGKVPTGPLGNAPVTSGAFSIPTTATGG